MQIKINTWYIFECQEYKIDFVEKVKTLFAANKQIIPPDMNKYLHVECLKLCRNEENTLYIRYRTNYLKQFMPDATRYCPEDVRMAKLLVENSTYGIHAEEENNMSNIESLLKLVDAEQHRHSRTIDEIYNNNCKDIVVNSDIAKTLDAFVGMAQTRITTCGREIGRKELLANIITTDMLSHDDKLALERLRLQLEEDRVASERHYNELRALLKATDTFAEAYSLLKAYGVVADL